MGEIPLLPYKVGKRSGTTVTTVHAKISVSLTTYNPKVGNPLVGNVPKSAIELSGKQILGKNCSGNF